MRKSEYDEAQKRVMELRNTLDDVINEFEPQLIAPGDDTKLSVALRAMAEELIYHRKHSEPLEHQMNEAFKILEQLKSDIGAGRNVSGERVRRAITDTLHALQED